MKGENVLLHSWDFNRMFQRVRLCMLARCHSLIALAYFQCPALLVIRLKFINKFRPWLHRAVSRSSCDAVLFRLTYSTILHCEHFRNGLFGSGNTRQKSATPLPGEEANGVMKPWDCPLPRWTFRHKWWQISGLVLWCNVDVVMWYTGLHRVFGEKWMAA